MEEEEERERPRPRVVDKRVSAGGGTTAPAARPASPDPAPATETPSEPIVPAPTVPAPSTAAEPPPTGPGGEVWTPEQEAQARQMAQEIAETPSIEWVVNTAVSLANIAATKLDFGAAADAQLAIDALSGILKEVGHRLQDAEAPLRQTLAQLQMAYAGRVAPSPTATPPK
ncbi:MAG: hypothetical protein QOH90_1025 [Actinomycetota bacterium]|nr:hypothetical protein [Actinomycetota bacterium]